MIAPNGYVEVNIQDAEKLSLLPGEVVRVVSPRGSIEVPVRIVDTVQPGLVFVPFHYGSWQSNQAANELTVDFTDPVCCSRFFKQASCRIEKIRKTYTIEDGKSLEDIATENNLTLEDLKIANQMMPPYQTDVGETIEVPLSMINVSIPPYMPYREIEKMPEFEQSKLKVTRLDLE